MIIIYIFIAYVLCINKLHSHFVSYVSTCFSAYIRNCFSSFVKYINLYLNRDNIFLFFIHYARIFLFNLPSSLYVYLFTNSTTLLLKEILRSFSVSACPNFTTYTRRVYRDLKEFHLYFLCALAKFLHETLFTFNCVSRFVCLCVCL